VVGGVSFPAAVAADITGRACSIGASKDAATDAKMQPTGRTPNETVAQHCSDQTS